MEGDRPLKHFLQKYSPVKRRDKPLPEAPAAATHGYGRSRILKATSGNTSPAKPISDNKHNPKSRLRSFFHHRRLSDRPAPSPSSHRRSESDGIRKSFRNRGGSQDLRRLTQKVSDLESQLKATKRELKTVSARASRPSSVEREQILDAERVRQQLATTKRDDPRYGGLAEHLLSQSYRDRNGIYRTLACKSTDDLGRAAREQAALEEADSDDNDSITPITRIRPSNKSQPELSLYGDEDAESYIQRRSNLRRKSWNHIQTQLESERESLKRRQNPSSCAEVLGEPRAKRTRRASSLDMNTATRDKELPLIKDDGNITHAKDPPPADPTSSKHYRPHQNIVKGHRSNKSLPNPPTEIAQPLKLIPPSDGVPIQPRKSNHRRKPSIIISRDDLDDALSPERPKTRGKQDLSQSSNWTTHPPLSPTRKGMESPSRLERVEEEYEWDEDVF